MIIAEHGRTQVEVKVVVEKVPNNGLTVEDVYRHIQSAETPNEVESTITILYFSLDSSAGNWPCFFFNCNVVNE